MNNNKLQEDLKNLVYNTLYSNSRVSSGVRCINEDEWPVEAFVMTISQLLSDTEKRACQEARESLIEEVSKIVSGTAYENLVSAKGLLLILEELKGVPDGK